MPFRVRKEKRIISFGKTYEKKLQPSRHQPHDAIISIMRTEQFGSAVYFNVFFS